MVGRQWSRSLARRHDIMNARTTCVAAMRLQLALLLCQKVMSCADVDGFADESGYTCADWGSYDCAVVAAGDGYTPSGVAELLENCQLSCSLCDSSQAESPTTETPPATERFKIVSSGGDTCEDADPACATITGKAMCDEAVTELTSDSNGAAKSVSQPNYLVGCSFSSARGKGISTLRRAPATGAVTTSSASANVVLQQFPRQQWRRQTLLRPQRQPRQSQPMDSTVWHMSAGAKRSEVIELRNLIPRTKLPRGPHLDAFPT